jgi:hypothetical protein
LNGGSVGGPESGQQQAEKREGEGEAENDFHEGLLE